MRTDQKLFCLKCVLTVFLIILWLLGSVVFGVLLWLRLDFWANEYLELDEDNQLKRYLILLYVSIIDGALIVLFSLFGLIGGLKAAKWALVVYLTAVCLATVLTISGSVYGFVYREELRDTVGKNDLIRNVILQRFNGEPNNRINRAVNIMQSELRCCGGDGPRDYLLSDWAVADPNRRDGQAPSSCCQDYYRRPDIESCPIFKIQNDQQDSNELNPGINVEGCKTALVRFFENYIAVGVGLVVTLFVLQLVCIIITSALINTLNNLYVPQPDDIVYDMARNQEKSPYPSRGDYRA